MICLAAAIVSAREPVGSSEVTDPEDTVAWTWGAVGAAPGEGAKATATAGGDDSDDEEGLGGVSDVIIADDGGGAGGSGGCCTAAVIGGGSSPAGAKFNGNSEENLLA